MLVPHLLAAAARRRAEAAYLIAAERRLSFATIEAQSNRLAATLATGGLERGDRVVCVLENSPEFVVAFWATLKAEGVFVPLPVGTGSERLAHILGDCTPRTVIASALSRERVLLAAAQAAVSCSVLWVADGTDGLGLGEPLPAAAPCPRVAAIDQDLCLILYTSGSSGEPKGVMLTHHNVCNNAWSIATYLGNQPEDIVLCALPLSFSYGLFQIVTAAHVGYTVALERSFAFPTETLRRIAAVGATGLPGVPTMFASLVRAARGEAVDLSSLRYVTNAGAAISPAQLSEVRALVPSARFFSMYGLTECTRVAYLDPAKVDAKAESVGRAIPNLDAAIVDNAGRDIRDGDIGELVVRGSGVMRGYWRRPAETAHALREGPTPGERRLFTGDLFRRDHEGDLFFVGRKDDMFKCRGEKVYPRVIESALYELDAVREAVVVGVPDADDGTAIKAFVVPHADVALTAEQVRRHCRERLERHLTPRFIELCAALPHTESGKVAKRPLLAVQGA